MNKIIIVCGHYGCGKTNYAINLAIEKSKECDNVTLCDLDLVNPYFRSADYGDLLSRHGIKLIAPKYANTNVDIPVLPEEFQSIFNSDGIKIIDVGGDDAGAVALGRFKNQLSEATVEVRYVINKFRNLIAEPIDAAENLKDIETAARIKADVIINNSHLKQETNESHIMEGIEYGKKVSEITGLPVTEVTVPRRLVEKRKEETFEKKLEGMEKEMLTKLNPIEIYVKLLWE
ncbi:MAG: carbonic anhydrase [Lachnospiraceae bacterium]|nr:carbonic anhydrase [Lachnospiraceae bacterium]